MLTTLDIELHSFIFITKPYPQFLSGIHYCFPRNWIGFPQTPVGNFDDTNLLDRMLLGYCTPTTLLDIKKPGNSTWAAKYDS